MSIKKWPELLNRHINTSAQHATNYQAMGLINHTFKVKVDLAIKEKKSSRCVLAVEWGDWPWRWLGWGLLFVKWAHTEIAKPHHPPAVRWAHCVQVGWVISWASAIRHTCRVKGNLFLTHVLSVTYQSFSFLSVKSAWVLKQMGIIKNELHLLLSVLLCTCYLCFKTQFTKQIMQMR